VSTEQRQNLDAILRQSAFPADSDVNEQRRQLRELISAQPLPADVTVTAAALGAVPTAEITVGGIGPRRVVLYFHGGVYVLEDAFARQAATADVEVTLDITPGVPHVFQAFYPILDEAAAALDRAGQLLSAHLASADRVTA
jgi:acetyl esterase/lipase